MRAVLLGDLLALVRVLKSVPAGDRLTLCRCIIRTAELADRYCRRLGHAHPDWGNGTLSGALPPGPVAPMGPVDDPETAACLTMVLEQLALRPRLLHM